MKKIRAENLPGRRVRRNRDGATGIVAAIQTVTPSQAHPGPFGKTVVRVRFDDPEVSRAAGGDSIGDLSWFRSYFKVIDG